jgi:cell division inhibitor SulA
VISLEFCWQLDHTDPKALAYKVSCTPITQFEQLSNAHKTAEMMKVSLRGKNPIIFDWLAANSQDV